MKRMNYHGAVRGGLVLAIVLACGGVGACVAPADRGDEGGRAFEPSAVRSYIETEPGPYEGVPVTVFEDTIPACEQCELRLNPVGAFGSIQDSVLLGDTPVMVERDSRGRFYAAVRMSGLHQVILYEPDGRIVRTVGRAGQGPGEFRTPPASLHVDAGDSLWVVDFAGFVNVFDSAGASVRAVGLNPAFPPAQLVQVNEAGILVSGQVQALDLRSHPLHLFDHGGDHLRSFGPLGLPAAARASSGREEAVPPQAWFQLVGRSKSGGLWVAVVTNYRLERIDDKGEVTRIVAVRGPESWNTRLHLSMQESLHDDTPLVLMPRPLRLGGIHELGDDLLLVVFNAPALDWEEAELRPHDRFPDDRLATEVDQNLVDARVDVIHLPTGAVLARTRLPTVAYATADGTVYTTTVDDLGVIRIEAFEVELIGFDGWQGAGSE